VLLLVLVLPRRGLRHGPLLVPRVVPPSTIDYRLCRAATLRRANFASR
jgi:hypothetical protein